MPYFRLLLIDSGANIVADCHQHVPQGVEESKHGLIFYGLGNLVFDPWGERIFVEEKLYERRLSYIASVEVEKNQIVDYKLEVYPFV